MQKGISRAVILAKAVEIIEREGTAAISMREIAAELGIKAPSLYNHVKGMDELWADVSLYAAGALRQALLCAIRGRQRDEALFALAAAYRRFAKEHTGLYKVTVSLPKLQGDHFSQAASAVAEPVFLVLAKYGLGEEESVHWQRILRSIIHGFLTQEEAGFFRHSPADVEASYRLAIQCFLNGLYAQARGEHDANR